MADDDHLYIEKTETTYRRTLHLDGVTTTVTDNRFEIVVRENNEVWEQLAVQQLREWCKWIKEKEKLRESRGMPS